MEVGWVREKMKDSLLSLVREGKDETQTDPSVRVTSEISPTLFPTFTPLSSVFECSLSPASLPHAQGSEVEKPGMLKLRTPCLAFVQSSVGKELGPNG